MALIRSSKYQMKLSFLRFFSLIRPCPAEFFSPKPRQRYEFTNNRTTTRSTYSTRFPNQKMARKRTKPQMRQLRLGAADDNSLVILGGKRYKRLQTPYQVDPELFNPLPFSDYTGDDMHMIFNPPFPILNLPEELIEGIIKLAYHAKYWDGMSGRGPYRPDARFRAACRLYSVCQLFRRLVIPLMYSSISLSNWPKCEATSDARDRLRYRTLKENLYFARHCRQLHIQPYHTEPPAPYETETVMSKFENVRDLTISGYFQPGESLSDCMLDLLKHTLPFVRRVENFELKMDMPEYEQGSWSEETQQPLELLCRALNALHNLKNLNIYGLNPRNALPTVIHLFTIPSLTLWTNAPVVSARLHRHHIPHHK
jgi:hypothetical protein